jgi:diadenosine tetraphosphate (Ap4A) HIT family hydrolase
MFSLAKRVSAALRAAPLRCEGINYWLADGEAAFQDVFHVHLHVFPRFAGDSLQITFDRQKPRREELEEIARTIAASLH